MANNCCSLQKARLKNLSHCNTLPFSEPAMMRHPLAMDTYDSDTGTSEDEDFTRVINDYDYSTLMPCNVQGVLFHWSHP